LTINKDVVAGKPSRGPLPDGAMGADPNAPVFAQNMEKARAEQEHANTSRPTASSKSAGSPSSPSRNVSA